MLKKITALLLLGFSIAATASNLSDELVSKNPLITIRFNNPKIEYSNKLKIAAKQAHKSNPELKYVVKAYAKKSPSQADLNFLEHHLRQIEALLRSQEIAKDKIIKELITSSDNLNNMIEVYLAK